MDAPQAEKIVPTQEGYDLWSVIYDSEDNPLIALEQRHVPAIFGRVDGLELLDVGCGTGRHALPLAQAGARVTAVDFSPGMLAAAQRKTAGLPVRLLHHNLAQPLPFADKSFDAVLSCLVLEHLSDLPGFFRELARVCRAGGDIVVTAMHPAMMLRGVSARFTSPTTGEKIYPQSHRQQLSDYVMAASHAGLRFVRMGEYAVDDELAARMPRAERHKGWPMLLLMHLTTPA